MFFEAKGVGEVGIDPLALLEDRTEGKLIYSRNFLGLLGEGLIFW